jgi:L-aspartate semialdehyde sulfurtransferase ferredoxin
VSVSGRRFHLTFPEHLAGEPVIYRLGSEFGLVTTIRRANLEDRYGWVILELEGDEQAIQKAVAWLIERGGAGGSPGGRRPGEAIDHPGRDSLRDDPCRAGVGGIRPRRSNPR